MEWYQEPYKGGRMLPVPGFPRSLYPPDSVSKGKTPSTDGPDVEAYKRTVWRAGRWPGPPSGFDRSFSNNFSHGKGPNVVDSGVAGVQRQQKLDGTGWIGEKTFNTLRSILVPTGPHKGEHCMDANALNLISQAWEMFHGVEPPPEPEPPPKPLKSTREKALEGAAGYLGVKESPSGSNRTKFGKWYGIDGQPWCAMFVAYCYEIEAGGSPSFVRGRNYAYVPYVVQDARNGRNGLRSVTTPIPGDLVCFDWNFDGTYDHIGIFEKWLSTGGSFMAIEGNTGFSNNSNGGEVMRRTRRIPDQGTVFVRVDEP